MATTVEPESRPCKIFIASTRDADCCGQLSIPAPRNSSATRPLYFLVSMAVRFWHSLTALGIALKRVMAGGSSANRSPILVVVEGQHDVDFLCRMSTMLHVADPRLPDLAAMERRGELVFVPFGGSDPRPWAFRLAGLKCPEFHLYDREVPPETLSRQRAIDMVNCRPDCRAFLTAKRSLENYLDGDSIFEASGIRIAFGDQDDVAELVARQVYAGRYHALSWDASPARARKRRRDKAKQWLNVQAVERMTPSRLAQRDPQREVRSWLETIAQLASGTVPSSPSWQKRQGLLP